MSGVTTRDALAKVLLKHGHAEWDEFDAGVVADALLASGAVIDAATLTDDGFLFDATIGKMHSQVGSTRADRVREVFRALAAALSERTS